MRILNLTDIIQMAKSNCVIVENGSGVLINPATGDFSYILTAKHVIGIYDGKKIIGYKEYNDIKIEDINSEIVELQGVITHDEADVAILITKKKYISGLISVKEKILRDDKAILIGFPESRRKSEQKIREFKGEVQEYNETTFVLRIEEKPDQKQVQGSSGGGVFKIVEDKIYLCGIESGMDGGISEYHGRVVCTHLENINKLLIEKNSPEIFPEQMHSFINIIKNTFSHFDNADDPSCFEFLKNNLHEYAHNFSEKAPSPFEVSNKLGNKLLIKNSPSENLFNENLWSAFLEFMLISSLLDKIDELNFETIDQVSKKRRFLFSACKGNWTQKLLDIFQSDFRGLQKGGVIIVSTNDARATKELKPRTFEKIVVNIGRVSSTNLMVDAAIRNPAKEFRLMHLIGLHDECVLDNDIEFEKYYSGNEGYDVEEMLEKFKEFYHANI